MTICIISDGGADLPTELAAELGIRIVPLTVRFGDEVMPADTGAQAFYNKMRESRELPKTASPSPHDFAAAYRAAGPETDILVLTISSALSSTYQNAVIARDMLLEDQPRNCGSIEVVDSLNASGGLGLLAYRAAKWAGTGMVFDELLQRVKSIVAESKLYVFLETLENVIKGGRLDRARGAVASMLNIKLVMKRSDEGTIEVVDKVRGSQQAIRRMIERIGEVKHDFEKAVLAIAHSNCEEKARKVLADILAVYPFRDVIFTDMGPVIGTYAGEGGILVSY
ncbi:DegV family protein [Paenibacillus chartarius]|uniref:DegV family protein n=1 Tax=Paenibacillus chartarius TaxID=747481 RepID=A0ABV6DVN8_9BACL